MNVIITKASDSSFRKEIEVKDYNELIGEMEKFYLEEDSKRTTEKYGRKIHPNGREVTYPGNIWIINFDSSLLEVQLYDGYIE